MTKFRGWLLLLLAGIASTSALADTTDDLRTLVEQGRHEAAYDLGSRHPELLGEPDFDYHFGIAATDSGHSGEGLLALERCLVLMPGNLAARAELARAYFVLGEDQRAREEFDIVLKAAPGDAVRRTVERYLDAIAVREARRQRTATFYVEAGLGADSNTNGGVSSANISLPVYGDVIVATNGVKKSDNFSAIALGGLLTHPLTPEWSVFGQFGLDGKFNGRHSENDIFATSLSGGIVRQTSEFSYRLSVGQDVVSVGSDRYRNTNTVAAQWQRRIGTTQALLASLQWADYAYTGANELRDAQYTAIGIGYRRAFGHAWQPVIQVTGSYGEENNERNRPDLGRDIAGLRLVLAVAPMPGWTATLGASYQDSHYAEVDTLLATRRHDGYYATDFGIGHALDRNLSVRAEVLLSENRSNIALYRYRRDVVAVKLRYDFK